MSTCRGTPPDSSNALAGSSGFGQSRQSVDMLNLVYHGTRDEQVYERLSERMKDRHDLFGSLPDTIEDDWISDIEKLDERLSEFTDQQQRARNAFDFRYGSTVADPKDEPENCARCCRGAMWLSRSPKLGKSR